MLQPFALPNELLINTLATQFPCRDAQIRTLFTLLSPSIPSPRNIVVHGLEATGKSAVTSAVLSALFSSNSSLDVERSLYDDTIIRYAIIKSRECITGRHLLETTIGAVAEATEWEGQVGKCENLSALAVEVGRMVEGFEERLDLIGGSEGRKGRFVLVFDGIDQQRDAPPTLLPALARLGEIIPHLTTIFIVTSPRPHFLHSSSAPHINFPGYSKSEALSILSLNPLQISSFSSSSENPSDHERTLKATSEIWSRYCSAVWDTLSKHSGRDIISFRSVCLKLWPAFTQPLRDGTYTTNQFSKLLVAKRSLLQSENILVPNIVADSSVMPALATSNGSYPPKANNSSLNATSQGITNQLPHTSRLLLVAAYLASYTPSRNDILLFSKAGTKAKKKKGGGTAVRNTKPGVSKHRKISRKLLGPQAFIMERVLAIYKAVVLDSNMSKLAFGGSGADLGMAVATLASLRLVVKTSPVADALDGLTKWKVNVGWDVVRVLARSVGVEVEDYVVD